MRRTGSATAARRSAAAHSSPSACSVARLAVSVTQAGAGGRFSTATLIAVSMPSGSPHRLLDIPCFVGCVRLERMSLALPTLPTALRNTGLLTHWEGPRQLPLLAQSVIGDCGKASVILDGPDAKSASPLRPP